ncbi:unnamed protein product [Peronospora belbahrii]|uniref:Nudix hydrolase domain-containing protein n=1 Tax=Peronospora belbahrii TaxID=622444 RepID=A0ABN8D527_9STRA|nr:unnamed protein product [Peronospora belbahrii]
MTAQTTKRTRSQTLPAAKHVNGDDHLSMQFRQHESLCLVNNQVQHDEQPRRKRPMVSVNLRFLEKMPPLRDYQRGRFGRRGGVDGGSSQWMRALEESMEETSFVTREAPTSAALVAPVPNLLGNRRTSNLVPVHLAVLGAGRLGIPATSAPLRTSYSSADEEAIRRRRLFALQATRGGGKDDEARPATEGLVL